MITQMEDDIKRMVDFRNIAVHDDQVLQLPITLSIITNHLEEFLQYSRVVLLRDTSQGQSPS